MGRPRGNRKGARLTVSLETDAYAALVAMAQRKDVSVAWLARRAITGLLQEGLPLEQVELPFRPNGGDQ